MKLEIECPSQFQGNVVGDLNSRRGLIIVTETVGASTRIEGEMPLDNEQEIIDNTGLRLPSHFTNSSMKRLSLFDIAIKTLEAAKMPLSAEEIWENSERLGIRAGYETKGKTPALSLGARCYMDIVERGEQSELYQYSSRPAKFYLTKYKGQHFSDNLVVPEHKAESAQKDNWTEYTLYPLLTYFVRGNPHFRALTKSINHTNSKRGIKGQNMWLFPDLVGVHYPFEDYRSEVLELQQQVSANSVRFYSFEMKQRLCLSNLRESYFQAVSNSSWANEGYLVALTIDTNDELQEELRRLNSAFGIGISSFGRK